MPIEYRIKVLDGTKVREFELEADPGYLLVELRDFLNARITDCDNIFVYKGKRIVYKLSSRFLKAPLTVSIVGTGYVGLVSGVGLCHKGRRVICVDIDEAKVAMINRRETPIFEKGLKEMLEGLPAQYFRCTTNLKEAVENSDCTIIAVGTPPLESGEQDLSYIKQVAKDLGKILKNKPGHIVVVKSTVIPGTTEKLVKKLIKENAGHEDFEIAMVPEFLREGLALEDFLNPFRIVIGVEEEGTFEKLKLIHGEFDTVFYKTSLASAEMIKYTSNALLATKISFANEIGNLCKQQGIDVYEVMDGVGLDKRINRAFLNAGRGFGGSCFPKDVKALISLGKKLKTRAHLIEAVWRVNQIQPMQLVALAKKRLGILKDRKVAVLGLAFKPGTDDIRESPAIIVIEELIKQGADVLAYDPVAEKNMTKIFPQIEYASDPKQIIDRADIVIGVTEWPELREEALFKDKLFIDGMKFIDKKTGKNYEGICW